MGVIGITTLETRRLRDDLCGDNFSYFQNLLRLHKKVLGWSLGHSLTLNSSKMAKDKAIVTMEGK